MGLFGKKEKNAAADPDARIKILGDSCSKCDELEKNVREALKNLNISVGVGHVTNFVDIAKYGVMQTPALVIDERVVDTGHILTVSQVEEILKKEDLKNEN